MGRHEKTTRALASMRRRGIALSGLAMIVAGCIWAAIAWGAEAEFKIQKPSGQYKSITIDDENEDEYRKYRYEGEPREGRSLASVLKELGIGDRAWTSVNVEGLTVQNGSFKNKKPPLFEISGSDEVRFYRPKTADGPAETRSGVGFASYRVPLEIEASDNSPKAGQTVTYEASVPGGGPQSGYKFTWTPSSGTGGTGPKFEYTYPETSGEVSINVTAKRGSDNTTVGTSTAATTEIEAPPSSGNTGGSGSSYNPPSGGFGGGFDSGYTPPSSDYDSNFPELDGSDTAIPDMPKTPEVEETPPVEDLGPSVEGELLSATAPLPQSAGDAGATSPEEEAPDPEAAIEEAEEISAPGALIAAGVVVGLLGLGAGREMENVRPRRLRRPDLSGLRRLSPPWK